LPATSGAIRAGRAFVELFADDSKLVRGLKRAQAKLRAFGAGIKSFGTRLLGVGTAAAAPLAAAVSVFTRFSDRMAEVRAITGASEDDFQRLEETAKRLGRTTSFSASQVAEGMKFLGMAGFSTEQILAGIPAVLDLARAGAVDLGLAADIASDVGSTFGMSADQIGRLADVMAKTATSANTSVEMMGESFKFVAPIARSAGQSLEETAAAIGILGNNGIKASMAGTDLKNILTLLANKAKSQLAKFGVSTTDAAGNMRPLLDVMRDLGRATSGLSQSERLAFFMETFGKISGKSAILLADAGSQIEDMRGKLAQADGAARKAAETMDANLGGAFRALMSAVEGLAIEVGEALAPTITRWADGLKKAAQFISNLVKKNREFFLAAGKVVAIVIGVGAALVALGVVIQGIAFGLGGLATIATGVGTALGLVGTILGALLSPIGAVIAAVAALATWLVTSTDVGAQALGWLGGKFQSLKDTALKAFQGISDALAAGDIGLAAKILWLTLKVEWKKGVNALNQVWVKVKEFFLSVWTEAVFGAAKIATNAWAGLQAGWTETVDFLRDAWLTFTTFIAKNWNRVVGFLKKAWQKLKSLVTGEDSSDVQQRIDAETARMNQELDAARNREIFEREQRRKKRLSEVEGQRTGTLAELERQREAEHTSRREQFASDLAKSENALAQARREWQQAIEEAARKRQESEAEDDGPARAEKPGDLMDRLQEQLSGVGEGLQQTQDKIGVTGTFNAAAVRGFAGGGPAERTAKASEETAKNTKKLVQQAQHGGLVFS
jgi:TP901 family phage tail tape measure protein